VILRPLVFPGYVHQMQQQDMIVLIYMFSIGVMEEHTLKKMKETPFTSQQLELMS
jgi:hypothetical protein